MDSLYQELSTIVVTGDKDMFQLVSSHVQVALVKKGISEMEWYEPETLREKFNLSPHQIVDLKGLMGDSSDNIPGIPGVGEKTALKLLHEFGSVENVIEQVDKISGKKLQEKVAMHKEDALLSKQLATIMRSVPIPLTVEDIAYGGREEENLRTIFKKFEFKSLVERIQTSTEPEELEELNYEVVNEENYASFEHMFKPNGCLHVELDQEQYHRAGILGFGVEWNGEYIYIPFYIACQWDVFIYWLQADNQKLVYDLKRSYVALQKNQLEIGGVLADVMLGSKELKTSEFADVLIKNM